MHKATALKLEHPVKSTEEMIVFEALLNHHETSARLANFGHMSRVRSYLVALYRGTVTTEEALTWLKTGS